MLESRKSFLVWKCIILFEGKGKCAGRVKKKVNMFDGLWNKKHIADNFYVADYHISQRLGFKNFAWQKQSYFRARN